MDRKKSVYTKLGLVFVQRTFAWFAGSVSCLLIVVAGGSASAEEFFLTKLADSSASFQSFGARVSLNDIGEAAWYGVTDSGTSGIFAGNGLSTRTIVTRNSGSWTASFDETPDINNQGDVTWLGTHSDGEKAVVVSKASGTVLTYLDTTGFLSNIGSRPKISSLPTTSPIVAGRGLFNGGENLWRGDGSLTTTIATTTGTNYRQFSSPVLSPNGQWSAARATLTNNERNIYSFHGTTPTRIAGTANGFSNVTVSDVTNQGVVAGLGESSNGSAWLFTGNGGNLTKIADTSLYATFSDGPGINVSGKSAFQATLHNGRQGVFTGDGQRVALTGNYIDGRLVDQLSFHPQGFNEQGQIAFRAAFDDGTEALYRADPVSAPPAAIPAPHPQVPTGKTKLVAITHGWAGLSPNDNSTHQWMNEMKSNIEQRIAALPDHDEWEVQLYRWTQSSGHPRHSNTGPDGAVESYNRAVDNGRELGGQLSNAQFEHIHLIGYSAGTALIDEAARQIKELSDTDPVVHLTSLDGFVPFIDQLFGSSATWSEQYMSYDPVAAPFTQSPLLNTHNVRVDKLGSRYSGHEGPRLFYSDSADAVIPGTTVDGTQLHYGFDLSREGGGWIGGQPPNLPPNSTPVVLGTNDGTPLVPPTAPGSIVPLSLQMLPVATSDTGQIAISQNEIQLQTGSPAWAVFQVQADSPIDFLDFVVKFSSSSIAEGLLSISFDGSLIGSVDEFFSQDHEERLRYLVSGAEAGIHELAFRLDSASATQSVVSISDIRVGQLEVIQVPGDYSGNGIVDATDYVSWRDHLGAAASLPNDATPGVAIGDYSVWKQNFGATAGGGSAANAQVPEPATLVLLIVGMLAFIVRRTVS